MSRVTFTAEPGTVLATGYDGHSVVLTFPDSGELSFDEKDQEPVAVLRLSVAEPSNAIAEKSAKPAKETK